MKDFQSPPYPRGFNLCVAGLGSDTHKETSDFYEGVVTNLEPRWRIIICKNKIQWILQKRTAEPLHKGIWRGRSCHHQRGFNRTLCNARIALKPIRKGQIRYVARAG